MAPKKIVVAIPHTAQRQRFATLVGSMPEFSVIAVTSDLMNTYNEVESRLPCAVFIADILAELPEFEVMRALFSALDIRWLVVSTPQVGATNHAKRVIKKSPESDLFEISADASSDQIATQLYSLTRTSQTKRQGNATVDRINHVASNTKSAARKTATHSLSRSDRKSVGNPGAVNSTPLSSRDRIIAIGSSTGGVDALLSILSHFPANCPPTLIVQHTGSGFGQSLASLLDRQCQADVHLISDKTPLARGRILIGAGARAHAVFQNGSPMCVALDGDMPVSGHLPSVDAMFQSLVPIASRVTAGILTGMGKDGALGLKALRDAGARTLAQDESTSVVYGMPRAAVEMGAAEISLPLSKIGPALLSASEVRNTTAKVALR